MYPLKRLDAREVCDAIIDLFMHTGIATVISSDNASNFVNKLTQEFEARLGCSQGLMIIITIITNEKIAVTLHKKLQGNFTQSNMRSQKTKHLAN